MVSKILISASFSTVLIIAINAQFVTPWIVGGPGLLPRNDAGMACGHYGGSIWILGGWNYAEQLVEYNIATNTFTDHGQTALSQRFRSLNQGYAQLSNILYMYDRDFDRLAAYNLETKQFVFRLSPPTNMGSYACIVADRDGYIYMTGGQGTNNGRGFIVYDINSASWLSPNPPLLNIRRAYGGCNYHPQSHQLFAIGGWDGGRNVDEIEKISTANVASSSWPSAWSYTSNKLLRACRHLVTILYDDKIYAVGGRCDGGVNTDVQVINVYTEAVTTDTSTNTRQDHQCLVVVNSRLYSFAGYDESTKSRINTWEYVDFPPTLDPTPSPTNPTALPSQSPTPSPTANPTPAPTTDPTPTPTINPTPAPTYAPTNDPTIYPTKQPTELPTTVPTKNPTTDPTKEPTKLPTNDPTFNPTECNACEIRDKLGVVEDKVDDNKNNCDAKIAAANKRVNEVNARIDELKRLLNGISFAHSSVFAQNQIKDDENGIFLFSNTDLVIISLLILNVLVIIFSVCWCWRNGLLGGNKGGKHKYSKVNLYSNSDVENLK